MRHKRLPGLALGIFFLLVVAGCGGPQNPHRFDTGKTPLFFSGGWDGLWAPLLGLQDFLHGSGYQLYWFGNAPSYLVGYIVGLLLCLGIIASVFNIIGAAIEWILPPRATRLADLVALAIVVLLMANIGR